MKAAFGVGPALLERAGTVDPEVAAAMAGAARVRLGADVGIGVTGVAGPAELEGKPAGTVHIAVDAGEESESFSYVFPPGRAEVKRRAVFAALFKARQFLQRAQ